MVEADDGSATDDDGEVSSEPDVVELTDRSYVATSAIGIGTPGNV